ncbi:MAG: hypothetical protein M3214_01270 [Actinomycetota bacterium]|nr:hypothetical protein [Actinomycetota bacterium]
MSHTKKLVVLTLVIAILLLGVMVPFAGAQVVQDGLVNVAIGDITIEDVNVNVAAQIAAAICAQDVNVLAVDQGQGAVRCDIGASNRDLVITNN